MGVLQAASVDVFQNSGTFSVAASANASGVTSANASAVAIGVIQLGSGTAVASFNNSGTFNVSANAVATASSGAANATAVGLAVNGVAAGAGANIALACDMVIAAKSAKFIQSFSALGLIPDSGGTWALPRLAGQARALGLALTGETLLADKAAEWGLIWKAVDDDALNAEVDAVANKLASLPPLGLAATKEMIRSSWRHSLEDELERQARMMRKLGFTEDYREGVAAFLEKRTPTFTGR